MPVIRTGAPVASTSWEPDACQYPVPVPVACGAAVAGDAVRTAPPTSAATASASSRFIECLSAEQGDVRGERRGDLRLRPEPVVGERRRGATVQVGLDLRPLRV